MENIKIREMNPNEADIVYKLGKRTFIGFESLWVSKPKEALIALKDETIVGAILYKIFMAGGRKIGYVDYAYIDPAFHGFGIGTILYKAATDFLWDKNCDALTAIVKDDNVGSWGLFQKNGFVRVSLPQLVRRFGFGGALKHFSKTPFCFAVGMEYYVAARMKPIPATKKGSFKQILSYLFANFLMICVASAVRPKVSAAFWFVYLSLLLICVFCDFAGTRFSSKRGWTFRLNNGGALVHVLVHLSGIFPFVGNWYPAVYEKSKNFQRDMGIPSLFSWIFLLVVTVLSIFSSSADTLIYYFGEVCQYLLIFRILPFYPFESFGGGRVYHWSKPVFAIMAFCSLVAVICSFVF